MASMSDGIQRMDRSDPESVSDPCMSSLGDQSEAWSLRGCEGTIGRPDAPQRIKMCGPKSVLPSKGDYSPSLEQGAAFLSLGHGGIVQSSATYDAASDDNKDITRPCSSWNLGKEDDSHIVTSKVHCVDPNTMDVSSTVSQNTFSPFKKLGQVNPSYAAKCGSTTSPLEESEPLRLWKEIKQNGFLSASHGGIPLPKQHVRKSRQRKNDEIKKKTEIPKRDQVNRFAKLAAPSGLLSRLDPGIIKHVRNSKQVRSILESMVLSEKQDAQIQSKFTGQLGRVASKETHDRKEDQNCVLDSAGNQLSPSSDRPSAPSRSRRGNISESDINKESFHRVTSTSSQLTSKYLNDKLTPKSSSALNMFPDNAIHVSGDDFSANQENITSLSLKAATVASQWLELLQLDIKGRLLALQRSKKRVRNVIQTELPYISSSEFSSNLENDPSCGQSSGTGCSIRANSDTHVARWMSLFSRMDENLNDEANKLESSLREVQESRMLCEMGLQFSSADCSSQLGSSEDSRFITFRTEETGRGACGHGSCCFHLLNMQFGSD